MGCEVGERGVLCRLTVVLLAGWLVLCAVVPSEASGRYWGVSYGLVFRRDVPESERIHDETQFESSCCRAWKVGLKVGYERPGDWVNRVELEGVFQSVDVRRVTLNGGGADLALGDWESWLLTLNGYRDFYRESDWSPYVGFGLGGGWVDADWNPGGRRRVHGQKEWVPVVQGLLGLDRALTASVDGFLEYRYSVIWSDLQFRDVSGESVQTEGPRDHQLEAGLRVDF